MRVALAGAGVWGRNHVRVLSQLSGCELAWVCDPDPKRRAAALAMAPRARCVPTLAEALAVGNLDAVVIASPAPTHAPLATAAIKAGCHVLVEKPLADDADAARTLVRLARRHERVLSIGHLLLHHPAVRQLKRWVETDKLGSIRTIHAQRTNLGRLRPDEGALFSLAPHDISIMVYLLGAWPVRVSATGGRYAQPTDADVVFVSLEFPGRRMGHIHLSWIDPLKVRRISVVGAKAMAVFDDMAAPEERLTRITRLRSGANRVVAARLAGREPLAEELKAFLRAARAGEDLLTPGVDGARTVQVLDAARRSLEMGGTSVPLRIR